ncbi:MAG: hypothetical protein WBV56_02185 [Azonexus sp.]
MISRRLLYLDTQRLTAYAWRHGKLSAEGVFEMRPEEYPRFTEYLRRHPNSQFRMLANVAEEGHELETIPFLQGADRKALITRKLGQHFLGSPLATAISLGYEKDKRKNEKLLLTALTNPAHFEPWLKCLDEAGAALAGIYTVAQMGSQLLQKLGKPKGRSLLLTYQDHSIRESYLVDGQPIFSRMTPLFDSSIAGVASRFATEAAKLYQYLDGQRHIGRNDTLQVYVLAHPQAMAAVRHACIDSPNLAFEIVDSHQAAKKIDLKTLPSDSSSELLYLHLLASAPPRQQFAGEALRHDYHVSQIRYGLLGLGAIALLGGGLFAAKQLYDTWSLRQETQALLASEADLSWRYREISATFPQLGIDNETLRRITDRQGDLLKQQRLPDDALRIVSHALDEAPNVHLEAIDGSFGAPAPAGGQPAPGKVGVLPAGNRETITLRGQIRLAPSATTRQTLATFEHFVELLRVDRNNEVSIVQQPFDIESGRSLRGGDADSEGTQPRQFAVKIVRETTP